MGLYREQCQDHILGLDDLEESMGNKGSVTIFCCLLIIAMVVLGISSVRVVEYQLAKGKGAMAVKSAMSGVDAGYNSYIFENYHILLFDKGCDGRGEAYLEEQLVEDIQHNLGDGFSVEEVAVSDYDLILEDDCQAFKEQIVDYCGYALLEYGAENILESTGGQDGTVEDYIYEDMEAAENSDLVSTEEQMEDGSLAGTPEQEQLAETSDGTETGEPDIPWLEEDDPRDYTEDLSSDILLAMVAPEDMDISNQVIDLSLAPSKKLTVFSWIDYEVDNDFQDMYILEEEIDVYDSWKDSLISGGAGVTYAATVFNCATESVQEETVFDFELEYIICGKTTDRDNLKGVVNRIIGIRLPVNYAYLLSDASKMAEIKSISLPIAIATLTPEPVVRYLIAGCWAYVESIFDVRCLLDGQRMDFFKTKSTWKTDLHNLEDSVNLEGEDSDNGLSYKDYLLILIAFNMDGGYYRMLDIIQLNTRQHYDSFVMDNAAVGFSLDAKISYQGKDYYYREAIGY